MSTIKPAADRCGKKGFSKKLISLIAFLGLHLGAGHVAAGEVSMSEYQVKALFLFNFTKYVAWPAVVFSGPDTPVVIGIYGEDKIGDSLRNAIKGKTISGRQILILPLERGDAPGKCNILFISDSEKKHLGEILDKIKRLPVLTVGESDQFMEQGGMINFVSKNGTIRLEINLEAARLARLEVSSRLLNVADVVKGK